MSESRVSLFLKSNFSLKLNVLVNFTSNTFAAVITIVFVPFYLRYIGIEAYGLVGLAASIQAVLSVLDLGLSVTVNRELAIRNGVAEKAQESKNLVRTFEAVYWLLALLIGVFGVLLAPLFANWINPQALSYETVRNCFVIMNIGTALQFPLLLYLGALFGLQKQVLLSVVNVIFALLKGFGVLIVLHFISAAPESFFISQTILSAVQVITTGAVLWLTLPKGIGAARFQKSLFRDIWRFAAGSSGISIMGILLTQSDKIILGRLLPLNIFGYYSIASLVSSGLTRLTVPIFQAYFPRFSQLAAQKDEKTLIKIYHQGCQVMAVVIFPIAVMFIFFSPEIMLLWQRNVETAENTYLLVSLMMIGSALNAAMIIPYALQLAFGWVKLNFYALTIAVVFVIPLTIILALNFGVVGASSVWLVLNIFFILLVIPLMHRRLLPNQKWKWYREDLFLPLISVSLVTGLARYLFIKNAPQIAILFQLILIFLIVFAAVCLASSFARNWIINRIHTPFKKV